jgi:hypothetical protein
MRCVFKGLNNYVIRTYVMLMNDVSFHICSNQSGPHYTAQIKLREGRPGETFYCNSTTSNIIYMLVGIAFVIVYKLYDIAFAPNYAKLKTWYR